MAQTFFYDEQIRRFLLQFIRVLSNFEVQFGKDEDGTRVLQRVPVRYGDVNRQGAQILRGNSENTMANVPMISCYINGLQYDRARIQEPNFISKIGVRERKYDPDTDSYLNVQGDAFTIERMMPVPYKLTLKADIWTSNTDQKLQLLEQMLVLFNPSLEIQSTDNYVDWTSLSTVNLIDTLWTNRAIPQGIDDNIDFATLTFEIPIFISAPAKVKKLGVINKIVASIYDDQGGIADGVIDGQILLGERMKFTPMNFGIIVLGNTIQILDRSETTTNKVDYTPLNDPPTKVGTDDISWAALVNQYGELQPGLSQIRLETGGSAEIIGTVAFHPSDPHRLLFTVQSDTIPTNDLPAITKIINPLRNAPDAGLATAAQGQRYLILNAIGNASNTDGPDAWGSLVAEANDIIEYNGNDWQVAFDSSSEQGVHYLTNSNTSIQYKYTGSEWVKSYEGEYRAGDWSLVI